LILKKQTLCIIGSAGIPSNYGGFETLVHYISKNLSVEYNLFVFCSSKNYSKKLRKYNGANLIYINLKANGIQGILYDIISLYKALKISNNIIILGASGTLSLPILNLFFKNKIIVTNIDGIEWKRDKWGVFEKIILRFSEKIACKYSNVIVSDNYVIKDYIDKKYNLSSVYIPYGGDHVKFISNRSDLISFKPKDYAVKVCRIEPENNVEMVLRAFSKLKKRNLVIVGNWKNSKYGIRLLKNFSHYKNIELLDPIFDQKELNKLRFNSSIYIHGHSAGGTNPSLVEAMFLNLPILCYDVNFNRSTTENQAIYFQNSDSLINELINLKINNSSKMYLHIKRIAENRYIWEKISNSYIKIFN
tara:strand:+ start:4283 stop:5365 length:1083 start_codon:yes stop_codon:yes gene_type:complete